MASYKISFKRSVEKDLRKIDKKEVKRILSSVEVLREMPIPPNSRKLVGATSTFRMRVGDYRVVYILNEQEEAIEIQRIRHRKDVYR